MHGLVDHEDVDFPGLGFLDGDGVTNSFSGEVLNSELEKVSGADSIVDTKGEKQEVSRLGGQKLFYAGDVVEVSDGFNGDFATLDRVIAIFHKCSLNVKYLPVIIILLNIGRELKNDYS
ncbi:hypothetical protein KL86DPRO_60238 [uncultured delta proteobacterium]|uniref:Uncharacterized protein n=1 Tax=uncultured delta proteobacterium TaxID=34034 RepID=A0A212KFY4_9DELT|nr:hypothetical protein KL86DPRO_60238 [uncultured delta proteobacterium]